jgi:hypothetical protein
MEKKQEEKEVSAVEFSTGGMQCNRRAVRE